AVLDRTTIDRLAYRLQRLLVSDFPRHSGDGVLAGDLAHRRAGPDRAPVALSDRPGRARRWSQDSPAQGRHAHHGRYVDPRDDAREHAPLGGAFQPPGLDGARGDIRLRPDRLLRRLP